MTIEYKNVESNILILDTVVGAATAQVYETGMPYTKYTVQVTPTGGAVDVAVSNDGTNYINWDAGSVSVSTIDSCDAIRYIRVTNTASTSTAVAIWGSK